MILLVWVLLVSDNDDDDSEAAWQVDATAVRIEMLSNLPDWRGSKILNAHALEEDRTRFLAPD